jgi:hypothetical protein
MMRAEGGIMSGIRKAAGITSDAWLLEQQLRAQMEAEAWRRLREALAQPPEPPAPASIPAPRAVQREAPIASGGSIILKALVRFALAAFGAYLAWIAGMDSGMGEFEVWLATGAGFIITLCLSMLEPARSFVRWLSEVTRWCLIVGAGFGVLWLALHAQPGA